METIERTPTPREQLHTFVQQLNSYLDDEIFYQELCARVEGRAHDGANIGTTKKFLNEIYTAHLHDDEGDETEVINLLLMFRARVAELATHVQSAFKQNTFHTLSQYTETIQTETPTNKLFETMLQTAGTELEYPADIEIIDSWYRELINRLVALLAKVYAEPELNV